MKVALPHLRIDSPVWWLVEVLLALLILLALSLTALSAGGTV